MNPPQPIDSPIFWLRRAQLAVRKALDEEFSKCELTAAQFEVLRHLWEQDGLEQRELQERLGITSATLTGIIDGMVERGQVQRCVSAEDARVKQIHLTEQGRTMHIAIDQAFAQVHARATTGFSATESALLIEWLKRVVFNLGASGEDCH